MGCVLRAGQDGGEAPWSYRQAGTASGLPGVECRDATYCLRPFDRLPAIRSDLTGELDWLPEVDQPLEWAITIKTEADGNQGFLDRARAERITLPRSFEAILRSPRRRWGRAP